MKSFFGRLKSEIKKSGWPIVIIYFFIIVSIPFNIIQSGILGLLESIVFLIVIIILDFIIYNLSMLFLKILSRKTKQCIGPQSSKKDILIILVYKNLQKVSWCIKSRECFLRNHALSS